MNLDDFERCEKIAKMLERRKKEPEWIPNSVPQTKKKKKKTKQAQSSSRKGKKRKRKKKNSFFHQSREARDIGLRTRISSQNIGYKLLAKMGYKAEFHNDPVPITFKADSRGLGFTGKGLPTWHKHFKPRFPGDGLLCWEWQKGKCKKKNCRWLHWEGILPKRAKRKRSEGDYDSEMKKMSMFLNNWGEGEESYEQAEWESFDVLLKDHLSTPRKKKGKGKGKKGGNKQPVPDIVKLYALVQQQDRDFEAFTEELGNQGDPWFQTTLVVDGFVLAQGEARSKKESKHAAAQIGYPKLLAADAEDEYDEYSEEYQRGQYVDEDTGYEWHPPNAEDLLSSDDEDFASTPTAKRAKTEHQKQTHNLSGFTGRRDEGSRGRKGKPPPVTPKDHSPDPLIPFRPPITASDSDDIPDSVLALRAGRAPGSMFGGLGEHDEDRWSTIFPLELERPPLHVEHLNERPPLHVGGGYHEPAPGIFESEDSMGIPAMKGRQSSFLNPADVINFSKRRMKNDVQGAKKDPKDKTCWDFKEGKCGKGARCKWVHEAPPARIHERAARNSQPMPMPMPLPFDHEAAYALRLNGAPPGFPSRKRLLTPEPPSHLGKRQPGDSNFLNNESAARKKRKVDPTDKRNICWQFRNGQCKMGSKCKWLHSEPSVPAALPLPSGDWRTFERVKPKLSSELDPWGGALERDFPWGTKLRRSEPYDPSPMRTMNGGYDLMHPMGLLAPFKKAPFKRKHTREPPPKNPYTSSLRNGPYSVHKRKVDPAWGPPPGPNGLPFFAPKSNWSLGKPISTVGAASRKPGKMPSKNLFLRENDKNADSVCWAFKRGKCTKGAKCKWDH